MHVYIEYLTSYIKRYKNVIQQYSVHVTKISTDMMNVNC